MKKTLFFALLSLLLLGTLLPLGTAAIDPAYNALIVDRAALFDDAAAFLAEHARAPGGIDGTLCVLTETSPEPLAESLVLARLKIDRETDAVVLVIRLHAGGYNYDMYTYGACYDAFSNKDIDRILDDPEVYNNLKAGRVEAGVARWLSLCADALNAHQKALVAKARTRIPKGILICAVCFLVAGGGAMLGVALYYRRKKHGESYPLEHYAKMNLYVKQDIFVGSYITRVYSPRNTSSGGGSRSGGGGGGGHRGGR